MIHKVPLGSCYVDQEVFTFIARSRHDSSWVLTLPGYWAADAVRYQFEKSGPLLVVDGSFSTAGPAVAIREALHLQEFPDSHVVKSDDGHTPSAQVLSEAVAQWAAHTAHHSKDATLPTIFVKHPMRLDTASAEILGGLLDSRTVRLITVVTTVGAMPEFLVRQWRVGRLQVLSTPLVTTRELDRALRRRLDGDVSPTVVQRMAALCDRHAGLISTVVKAAQASGVLHYEGNMWRWGVDETPFRAELARIGRYLLSGFTDAETELLILTAVSGSLPRDWAIRRYGPNTVHSLVDQRLLGANNSGIQGYLDLRITAEAVQSMVLSGVGEIERVRLWHTEGRNILPEAGGPASQAARIRWKALAEGQVSPQEARQSAEYAIARGWYRSVLDVSARLTTSCPRVHLLAARAHLALGHPHQAVEEIETTVINPANHGTEVEQEVLHQAAVLAERITLFHPSLGAPVVDKLQRLSSASLHPELDAIKANMVGREDYAHAHKLAMQRIHCMDQECILGRLWLGARLGLRAHADMGRLMLASVLDDLAREGGQPDVEESIVALLLLITSIHGWHTDVLKIEMHLRKDDATKGPAISAVADVIATVSAMQQDRMLEAYNYAKSATTTFAHADPFGLHAFASSLAAATSSYLSDELTDQEHARHWALFSEGEVTYGPESLRFITEGMAQVGTGKTRPEINARLFGLAQTAEAQEEWAQHQQLVLLAMLGGSAEAAQAALQAPWQQDPGRPTMIAMLARALTQSTPEEAVEIAELLINSDSMFFGLSVLIHLWQQKDSLDRGLRTRIMHIMLACRRRAGEVPWLLRTTMNFQLDKREAETLRLLEAGLSSRDIAKKLHFSQRTVETTISGLCQRFACANRVELLALNLLGD